MARSIIEVNNVAKSFRLPHDRASGLKQAIINFRFGKNYETQHVLKGLTFDIKEGEFFGIVGSNGSGKSTLLKLLAQTYVPNSGTVKVHGSLTPFIELGVGFNPELTGRENVYLNGALLGFSASQMQMMYDDIVNFAELHKFMDQKLKNYSSGMQVRLAFSIAIRAKSDILLIDEVLAVGDEAFQQKCLDVFDRYKAKKQTIILVTHDMDTVRKYCSRAMLIKDGEITAIGNPRKVADIYSNINQASIDQAVEDSNSEKPESNLDVQLMDVHSKSAVKYNLGDTLRVRVDWTKVPVRSLESVGINIFKLSGEHVTGINSRTLKLDKGWFDRGHLSLDLDLNVSPGKYYVLVETFSQPGRVTDSKFEGLEFMVANQEMTWSGLVELPHRKVMD